MSEAQHIELNGKRVRTATIDGVTWYMAKDVAIALGCVKAPQKFVRSRCKSARPLGKDCAGTGLQSQSVVISEADVLQAEILRRRFIDRGNDELTVDVLKTYVHYCPESGVFTRKVNSGGWLAGSVAGGLSKSNGYWKVSVNGCQHFAHRLAWLYVHGEWPKYSIDHINGDRLDNRIANLRDVPAYVNNQNQRKAQGGALNALIGASRGKSKEKPWRARIHRAGKEFHLGIYETQEQAHEAYKKAKRVLHEGCTI
jgi:hypothetical protein